MSHIDDTALRAIVREAVARHLGGSDAGGREERQVPLALHSSHFRYTLPERGGPCLIEPGVGCNHCGYCQSHGH
jgi:hypothetical protein